MDTGLLIAIILIAIIFLDIILKFSNRQMAIIQLVILVASFLALTIFFFIDGSKRGYQYPYLIFIFLGLVGLYRKFMAFRNQKFD